MIDKPIIEALASLGTGLAPRFQWTADALSLKSAIDNFAVNRVCLPGECDDGHSVLALAMGLHKARVKTTRSELPQKQFRRIATISMQLGLCLAEVGQTLDVYEHKVVALLERTLNEQDILNAKPNLQALLVAATCIAKLPEGKCSDLEMACRNLLMLAACNSHVFNVIEEVIVKSVHAEETKDFVAIAEALFPDVGENCTDEIIEEENGAGAGAGAGGESADAIAPCGGGTAEPGAGEAGAGEAGAGEAGAGEAGTAEPGAGEAGAGEAGTAEAGAGEAGAGEAGAGEAGTAEAGADEAGGSVTVAQLEEPVSSEPNELTQCYEVGETIGDLSQSDELQQCKEAIEKTANEQTSRELIGGMGDDVTEKSLNNDLFAKNQNLVTEIVRILQSEDKRLTELREQGRRIAGTRIWRLKRMGDTKVFRHTSKVIGSRVAVEILIDGSQSMGADLKVACEVGLSFCDAVQRLTKASSALSIFAGRSGISSVVKEHNEGIHQVRTNLTSVIASGGTPTGAAIRERIQPLLKMRQDRKIMIVITDGCANNAIDARQAADLALAEGIEVFGIGVGREGRHILNYIDNSVSINSLNELQYALRKMMSKRALA